MVVSGSNDRTVRVWDLATGAPVGGPFTGHTGGVHAVAAGELDGRPVVISGSDDRTVRVWDLATGAPVGGPFTGHDGWVYAVAAAELDGRPVVISGSERRRRCGCGTWPPAPRSATRSPATATGCTRWRSAELDGRPVVISGGSDGTVRVWDLATGTPVGGPFTGHPGSVNAVAAAELDGRPVVISGSSDETVRVWDLATGAPVGAPFTGHGDGVRRWRSANWRAARWSSPAASDGTVRVWDLATGDPGRRPAHRPRRPGERGAVPDRAGANCGRLSFLCRNRGQNVVTASAICLEADGNLRWEQIAAPEVRSDILALALISIRAIIVATELGIVVFDLPPRPGSVLVS